MGIFRIYPFVKPAQFNLKIFKGNRHLEHGGSLRKGQRKIRRPFDSKRPLHLVLRSSKAKGAWSFLAPMNKLWIEILIPELATRFGVKVYRFSNSGNHLHLLINAPSRRAFQSYLRSLSGLLARKITHARKGHPIIGGKFWDELAFTKVLSWGREFLNAQAYLVKNAIEGLGASSVKRRKDYFVRVAVMRP
jgi:REP element-mobilizing transposase RayT